MIDWNTFNNTVSQAILDNDLLGELLSDLGCDLRGSAYRASYRLPCPIHGGRSPNMEVVTDGHVLPIRWRCYSHNCQDEYKPSLLGLVRGILSTQQGHPAPMRDVTNFLSRYVKYIPGPRNGTRLRPRHEPEPRLLDIPREVVRRRLAIPSKYFLSRGFSRAVLDEFDVGDSSRGETKYRAVVPLYDDEGMTCIGYMARSKLPECENCGWHHYGADCRYRGGKWKTLKDFPKSSYVFNYTRAKATDAPFIFVVEGIPDVLRLAEAGYVGVALLGSDVSDEQLRKLAALGKEVWAGFDNDKGGDDARTNLGERKKACPLYVPTQDFRPPASYKDIGDTPVDTLRQAIAARVAELASEDARLARSDDERAPWDDPAELLERSERRLREHEAWLRRTLLLT